MRAPLTNRDPGDEQPEPLFDPQITNPKKCSCGTTRPSLCTHDANVNHGLIPKWTTRPRTCLNRHDPSTQEIPY